MESRVYSLPNKVAIWENKVKVAKFERNSKTNMLLAIQKKYADFIKSNSEVEKKRSYLKCCWACGRGFKFSLEFKWKLSTHEKKVMEEYRDSFNFPKKLKAYKAEKTEWFKCFEEFHVEIARQAMVVLVSLSLNELYNNLNY